MNLHFRLIPRPATRDKAYNMLTDILSWSRGSGWSWGKSGNFWARSWSLERN